MRVGAAFLAISTLLPVIGYDSLAAVVRRAVHAINEPARALLLRVAKLYDQNIALAADVHGLVTLDLNDVTFDQALEAIAVAAKLKTRHERGLTFVSEDLSSAADEIMDNGPAVVPLSIIRADHAALVLRRLFPQARIEVDRTANAIVIVASAPDLSAIRAVVQALDIKDPTRPAVESVSLNVVKAPVVAHRLAPLYPKDDFEVATPTSLLIRATAIDMSQIKAVIAALDTSAPTPTPMAMRSDAVNIVQREPSVVARAVANQFHDLRVGVSGAVVILVGPPDEVERAKGLVSQLDVPSFGSNLTSVYRLRNVDASSVGDFLVRSFSGAQVYVDKELNAISVRANSAEQQRISDAVAKLDGGDQPLGILGGGMTTSEVVTLQSVIPSQSTGSSATTPQDIANAVTQSLQGEGDLRIVVPANVPELVLTGSPQGIRRARDLIAKLDVIPPSIVLDTQLLELDQTGSKDVGLLLSSGVSTTFSEVIPPADPTTGVAGRISGFQALTRTPITFQATLNLLLQSGNARVLANPRITTLSGRTASIRAGDTISILTTTGGSTGTIATTQLQSFQTGVQLDITPVISSDGAISVALHPVVNSLTGYNNGVPQISTRDAQTTVHLHDNETLVIGGLIQDSVQRTTNKLPILGDLPLVGPAFRNDQTQSTRNELVIVVTPHIVRSAGDHIMPGAPLPTPEPPRALPTLPPGTTLLSLGQPSGQLATPATPSGIATAQPFPASSPTISPSSLPSAFGSLNTFTYGSPPPNNSARPGDFPTIYYVSFQPTVVSNGVPVTIAVITSTNVQRVSFGPPGAEQTATSAGPGKWLLNFAFSSQLYQAGQKDVSVSLRAARADGLSTSVLVPITIQP